jgi:hypothetical protein
MVKLVFVRGFPPLLAIALFHDSQGNVVQLERLKMTSRIKYKEIFCKEAILIYYEIKYNC